MAAGGITEEQRRLLNAICGDLSKSLTWHGLKMDKDSWRWLLSGSAAGWRAVPGIQRGEGHSGLVMLGSSSLKLTKEQAGEAINLGVMVGDSPSDQGISDPPVKWSRTVLLGLGFNPNDFE